MVISGDVAEGGWGTKETAILWDPADGPHVVALLFTSPFWHFLDVEGKNGSSF